MDNCETADFAALRLEMTKRQIEARGITDERVLATMARVPRHRFVNPRDIKAAYADHPLPVGEGQTISQPYMVALMTEKLSLEGKERVLEIGTGSGYQSAILAELSQRVYTVERVASLAERARRLLEEMGYQNIEYRTGDGTQGWEEHASFDRIMVTAGSPDIPESLGGQLAEGGQMVIPVGRGYSQDLVVATKGKGKLKTRTVCGCVFVPLIGKYGWEGQSYA